MLNFIDTETCGLAGPPVLYQFENPKSNGIQLYELWHEESNKTLDLIEEHCQYETVGFNLVFDWFQINYIYNIFRYLQEAIGPFKPIKHIKDLSLIQDLAKKWCVKPKAACDLMLVSRRGPFQSLMERKPIRINRVPTQLCYPLIRELEKQIQIPDIYFARSEHKKMTWTIHDIEDRTDVKRLVLNFAPSGGLKSIHQYLFETDSEGDSSRQTFDEIKLSEKLFPEELLYAPHKSTWPSIIEAHIDFWRYNTSGRKYARKDIVYTKDLYYHPEFGSPEPGDRDSTLACLVGAVRWSGFKIRKLQLERIRNDTLKKKSDVPTAPAKAWEYISEFLDPVEKLILKGSTKKIILEDLAKRKGELGKRAKAVLQTRQIDKRVEIYDKLLRAGKFFASFNICGTLSNRMSGTDDLNAQGIPRDTDVRECFDLAEEGYELWGGDFDQFEVVIADAEFADPNLRQALLADKKIHALFAMELYPEFTYDEIMATKGDPVLDRYGRGKNGVFTMIYGGDYNTLVNKYGIDEEIAKPAEDRWNAKYPKMAARRAEIFNKFCTLRQQNGLGTAIEWSEPDDYIESFLGFRRYFTLENKVAKILFKLAQKLPPELSKVRFIVKRFDREQSGSGAVQSALYGAAFQILSKNMRAAANHIIQSPGAEINKSVQCSIWEMQPVGCSEFVVKPMNVHDEIMCPVKIGFQSKVKEKVFNAVESFRSQVPLIKFEWLRLNTWADK